MENAVEQEIMQTSKDMSGWLKLVGIVSIVGGGLSILLTFGIAIVIAWLPIWQGILLVRASNGSQQVSSGDIDSITAILNPMKIYFIIQGVLIIIGIFGWIIGLLIFGLGSMMDILGGSGIY